MADPETTTISPEGQEGQSESGAEATPSEGTHNRHDDHLKQAIKERNKAKAELREIQARLSDIESQASQVAEEKERNQGEWAKVDERQKRRIEKLTTELNELRGREEKRIAAERESALLESVATKSGIQNRRLLRGLLREAAAGGGFEAAPEEVTETLTSEVVEAIKEISPELFNNAGGGGSPGIPGTTAQNKAAATKTAGHARIDDIARRMSEQFGIGKRNG